MPYSKHGEWDSANIYDKWTFTLASEMIEKGYEKPLQLPDLMELPQSVHVASLVEALENALVRTNSKGFLCIPRVMVALIRAHWSEILVIIFYTVTEGLVRIASPALLFNLIQGLQDTKRGEDFTGVYTIAGILGGLAVFQTFIHHILFFMTMRLGWKWKASVIALLYQNLFKMNAATLSSTGTGKLVNLVSNDVSRYEEFTIFMCFFPVALFEVVVIMLVLIFRLNVFSAVAAVGLTITLIPIQLYTAKQFASIRAATAAETDQRVRHISEVIDGINSVKSYTWEIPFFKFIDVFRVAELFHIRRSQVLKALNFGLYYAVAPVASFITFVVFKATGGTLTLPIVFSVMSLLTVLRTSIGRHWTRSIETGSEALAASKRIENFLNVASGDGESSHEYIKAMQVCAEEDLENSASTVIENKDSDILSIKNATFTYESSAGEDDQDTKNTLTKTVGGEEEIRNSKDQGISDEEDDVNIKKCRDDYNGNFRLQNINLSVKKGELVVVVGPVGSGKSSLLGAILDEMSIVQGSDKDALPSVEKKPEIRTAYCAQRPWILATTVKENITLAGKMRSTVEGSQNTTSSETNVAVALVNKEEKDNSKSRQIGEYNEDDNFDDFGLPVSIDLYRKSLQCCRLIDDMNRWPWYDETEIGERGVSISGGQKARIALARAVYSDADLYLLDDPLSACDAEVGKSLFFECIVDVLKAKHKGILLCTHQLQYLSYADRIVVLDNYGKQRFYGTHIELNQVIHKFDFFENKIVSISKSTSWGSFQLLAADNANGDDNYSIETSRECKRKRILIECTDPNSSNYNPASLPSSSSSSVRAIDAVDNNKEYNEVNDQSAEEDKEGKITVTENRIEGKMATMVWWKYLSSGGALQGVWVIFMAVFSQVLLMISDYWLRWWTSETFAPQNDLFNVYGFAILSALCIFVGPYRATTWFVFTRSSSKRFYRESFWSVIHSPMGFFVANPKGRILNRFAKDQNIMDELLPVIMFDFIQCALYCLSTIIIVCITVPVLTVIIPPLWYHFYLCREKYLRSSREIKRIEAITRSPIFANFSSTLEGLSTLRAYKLESKVAPQFFKLIDINSRSWYSFLMVSRWLGFRLDLECAMILIATSLGSVIVRQYSNIDVGLLGFTMVYVINLSGLFQWTVRQSAEVETMMTSVERIADYAVLPAEDGYKPCHIPTSLKYDALKGIDNVQGKRDSDISYTVVPSNVEIEMAVGDKKAEELGGDDSKNIKKSSLLSSSSKHLGHVEIKNLIARYRDDLDPVLNDVSLSFAAGSKIGVCGRTGSGKSSLLLALLRLNIISSGDILVDGKSLLSMHLEDARSLISVIPQDPHLFSGTIRFNLDPFNLHTDEEIWSALQDAHIHEYISKDPLGLQGVVEEGGKNFSVGQRQLLSLSRAVLRNASVVLCDEVTASIDYQTDKLIQETIRTSDSLKHSTIITVAHRLRTIADSDQIVVVHAGKVVEMGKPLDLLYQRDSHFRALVDESNEYDDIVTIAKVKSGAYW